MEKELHNEMGWEEEPENNYIAGIFNYCDRWCERCGFTSRCSNYSPPDELDEAGPDDAGNERYWANLTRIFEATFDLLVQQAHELGIDLQNINTADSVIKERAPLPEFLKKSDAYAQNVHSWLDREQEKIWEGCEKLLMVSRLKADQLHDGVEVIRWYGFFISPKLARAAKSMEDDNPAMIADANGSAKVALIAIERTISAFTVLWENLKLLEDDILKFLQDLVTLKRQVLDYFPDAMQFKRPGFDEPGMPVT